MPTPLLASAVCLSIALCSCQQEEWDTADWERVLTTGTHEEKIDTLCDLIDFGRMKQAIEHSREDEEGAEIEHERNVVRAKSFRAKARFVCPLLLKALKDEDWILRSYAAQALGSIRSSPDVVVPALIEAAETDVSPKVRKEAILALPAFGASAEVSVHSLVSSSQNQDAWVRCATTVALVSIGRDDKRTYAVLERLMSDEDVLVRMGAANALEVRPGGPELAIPYLLTWLDHPNRDLRRAAISNLEVMGQPADPKIESALCRVASTDLDATVRQDATDALESRSGQ